MLQRTGSIVAVAVFATILVGAILVRSGLDVELTPTGIHAWVQALGWKGPVVYFGLVVFRQFLAIPAIVILPAAGICFGTLQGGLLSALGLIVSGTMKFTIARLAGRDWLRRRGGQQLERFEAQAARLGPLVIGLSTAHPLGPLSPLHWGAGLSPLSLGSFVLALTLGAPVRAFAYSYFGQALLDANATGLRNASLVLAATIAVPLLFPQVRARLRAFGEPVRD